MPTYGKVKVDTITYDLSGTATDVSVSNIATKASPTFTGTVTVPTPSANDNTTKAASTAYVQTELGDYALKAGPTFTGTVNAADLVLSGDLTVNGSTTTIDTTTLQVEDKNIQIGKVSTPSDVTADGGGLTLLGATNKTWNWVNATDAWTSSEHIHLIDNKKLLVGGASGTVDGLEIVHNASDSILNDTGTGALKLQLGGSTKLEIQSGGINVTGAINVNGSALSTSPTVDLVADGAITAGKPCIVTAAGKAKQVGNSASAANGLVFNTGSQATQGTAITPASGYYNTAAYDDDSDTVALLYKDTNASNAKLRLFSTSGDGLGIIADPVIISGLVSNSHFTICKLSNRRFAVPYWNPFYGGNGRMEIVIVTVNSNANGISVGSAYSLDGTNNFSYYNEPHAVAIGDNRIAVICKAHNTSCQVPNGKMALLVGDITSGNVYTARSNAQITSETGDGQYRSIGYDSTNDVVGVAFTNNNNDVKFVGCKVAAGTGAAITQGTAADLTTTGSKPNIKWHSNSGSWISVVSHNNTSLRAQAHTINSATLAITSGTAVDNATQGYPATPADICISNQHLIYFIYTNSSNKCHALSATVSGTALTLNTSDITEQISGTSLQKTAAEFMAHNDKIVMFGVISGNYISGTGNTTNITSNLTTENYIGIAKAGASNNATATIDVSGSTNSSQSSLTPGQKYYVQGDGTLGLAGDTTKVFAGTAVAATKLIVNDQQPVPATPATPGWTKLASGSATSGQNILVTNDLFTSTYFQYKIIFFCNTTSGSPTSLGIHFTKDGGSNWIEGSSGDYRYTSSGRIGSTNLSNNNTGTYGTSFLEGNTYEQWHGEITITKPSSTSTIKSATFVGTIMETQTSYYGGVLSSSVAYRPSSNQLDAVTGIRFTRNNSGGLVLLEWSLIAAAL